MERYRFTFADGSTAEEFFDSDTEAIVAATAANGGSSAWRRLPARKADTENHRAVSAIENSGTRNSGQFLPLRSWERARRALLGEVRCERVAQCHCPISRQQR